MTFIAPHVHDLADFAKRASFEELLWEIRRAVCAIETPDVMERARRTMFFLDDMPIIMQGIYNQGFFAHCMQVAQRYDNELMQ